jgi:CheY-like chemotaxis protein
VLTNLVLNAVDAMPNGGDLDVYVRRAGDSVEVEVRDTGCGIPPEILARVFDPFFSTKGEQGNGLGLAIAKEIVERHGGSLRVSSAPGSGATMTVSLPAAVSHAVEEEAVPEEAATVTPSGPLGQTVLVVDDEEGVLRVLATMLRTEGFRVVEAASGDEATRRMDAGERFDLVITDLYMPGTSGMEVIAKTRSARAADRVIVMSGYGDVTTDSRLAEHSIDGVLPKPFTLSDVRDVVANVVR